MESEAYIGVGIAARYERLVAPVAWRIVRVSHDAIFWSLPDVIRAVLGL